LTAEQHPH